MFLENVSNVLTMHDVMDCIVEAPNFFDFVILPSRCPQFCKKRNLVLRWVTLTGYDAGGEVLTSGLLHLSLACRKKGLAVTCCSADVRFVCLRCGASARSS